MKLVRVEKPFQLIESSLKSVGGRFSTGSPRRPLRYAKIGAKIKRKANPAIVNLANFTLIPPPLSLLEISDAIP
jgi:hypothetical protein